MVGEKYTGTKDYVGEKYNGTKEFVGLKYSGTKEFVGEKYNATKEVEEKIDEQIFRVFSEMRGKKRTTIVQKLILISSKS